MKAILISIKPKYVAKILNGEKTIEIRKTMPKCDLPIDVYIYCTKEEYLTCDLYTGKAKYHNIPKGKNGFTLSGKVVAKFTLNHIVRCRLINDSKFDDFFHDDYQLSRKDLREYVGDKTYYEWHISNLVIFDKPKELSEFWVYRNSYGYADFNAKETYKDTLIKAPQSWQFIEVE